MKLAVVTGAAQGIGRRTAEILAAAGYSLALCWICNRVLPRLPVCAQPAVKPRTFPVTYPMNRWWKPRPKRSARDGTRVDVLVNNAGISSIAPAETIEARTFRRVLEVNLVAPFLLARAFGKMMLQQRAGSIVNVASIAGLSRHRRPRRLQRIQARADRAHAHLGRGVGRARRALQCCLSRVGEDGNGRG